MTRPSMGLRRALVAGAASGIGRAAALRLRASGVHVSAIDIRDPGDAADQWFPMDIGQPEAILPAFEAPIQALVNAAGLPPRPGAEAEILRVNFFGPRRLTQHALDSLDTGASIVNMASRAGAKWRENIAQVRRLLACPGGASAAEFVQAERIDPVRAYDLSKEAVIAWTKVSTGPLIERSMRMNCVSPAAVDTPILPEFVSALGERATRGMALTRRSGTAEEIAEVIHFLCQPASSWIKGCNIEADGGLTAQLEAEDLIGAGGEISPFAGGAPR